ncbi:MAG: hypothetical protein PUG91_12865 [Clostridiales bacterium]|nr:hypothetical protein [Clostridiales bacterium]
MAFIPIVVPRKNEKFRLIAGVLLIILGLFFAVTGLTISSEALDTATIGTDALSTGKNYYIEDAVILDQFGYTEKDGQNVSYECAVGFGLANDEWVVTAIEVPLKSALFSTVQDYLNDSSQNIGDLRMPMYVSAGTLDAEFCRFLDSYFEDVFGADNADYTVVNLQLKYRGTDEAAFKKSIDSDRFTLMGLGAAIAVIGALLFGLGLGQRRKRLDALENAAPADSTAADNAAADENA